jgi:hypothetical protein
MNDIFLSLPQATEFPCTASAIAKLASGHFGELKTRRDDG